MKVAKLPAGSGLADPGAPGWKNVAAETVALAPVPLAAQPNAYIQEAWKGREFGKTAQARVSAASDGAKLYVRLEWADDARPHGEFQDAAGALFPLNGGGSLSTLGSGDSPVAIWFWENGRPSALSLTSRGPGVRRPADGGVEGSGALANGTWAVVLAGPAAAASGGKLGVAVWNGSNDERAGIAAVSRDWLSLESD